MIRRLIAITSNPKVRDAIETKKSQTHKKQDSSYSSSSDYDLSNDSKRRKNKSNHKKDHIKLCVKLKAKLLMTAYKSKIIKFKLD